MQLILDPPANGPFNMQRDLDLLEGLGSEPILRCYEWSGDWASYGYFQTESETAAHFPAQDLQFVKRPTGGGIVDHREDLTYTLLIPKSHPLGMVKRTDCYRLIHQCLQSALKTQAIDSRLLDQEEGAGPACFVHPVPGDLVDCQTGLKVAGAAQRRTRQGLLHQGSILTTIPNREALARALHTEFASSFSNIG